MSINAQLLGLHVELNQTRKSTHFLIWEAIMWHVLNKKRQIIDMFHQHYDVTH